MKTDDDLRSALHDLAGEWHDDGRIRARIHQRQAQDRQPKGRTGTMAMAVAAAAAAVLGVVAAPRLLGGGGDGPSEIIAGEGVATSAQGEAPASTGTPAPDEACESDGLAIGVAVPDVRGLTLEDASDMVSAAGLTAVTPVDGTATPPAEGSGGQAVVSAQEPAPGELVRGGTCVRLQTTGGSPSGDEPGDGSGLEAAVPGREITFDRIGEVQLGQVLDPAEVEIFTISEGDDCGSWSLSGPDGSGPALGGEVSGASSTQPRVTRIKVSDPAYRTASGVGVGTTLDTLRQLYGDRLSVDRADGWEQPTDGLLASYQDVAAVRYGDFALTYILMDDVVERVKLSRADDWGDDEGCA